MELFLSKRSFKGENKKVKIKSFFLFPDLHIFQTSITFVTVSEKKHGLDLWCNW